MKRATDECHNVYACALNLYGIDAQLNQLQEECAELIVAISHYRRNRIDIDGLVKEMVDVDIVMGQIKMIIDDERYNQAFDYKMDRLKGRIGYVPERA